MSAVSVVRIDHLLYVGPDLGELAQVLLAATGLTATVGGKHPGQGTHNALLSLGADRYLELMAPDPEQSDNDTALVPPASSLGASPPLRATPPGIFLRSIAYATQPQLFTWCAKAADAGSLATAARSLGLEATLFPGSRLTPAGMTLRWDLVVIAGHGLGGVVPFFIDWHDSQHPTTGSRSEPESGGLRLVGLELRHPAAEALTSLLHALCAASGAVAGPELNSAVSVALGAAPEMVARFAGPLGPFELSGRGGELVTS